MNNISKGKASSITEGKTLRLITHQTNSPLWLKKIYYKGYEKVLECV